ncbi:hypothetical protein G6F24_018368 [Rhizopus arrhizus]|nr:hypothetical protein G6F24_018368 [Rhizopus arrhizus]
MYHNALPAALIRRSLKPMPGTVADRVALRLAVLAPPGLCLFQHTSNNARFMDEIRSRNMRTTAWDARPVEPGR